MIFTLLFGFFVFAFGFFPFAVLALAVFFCRFQTTLLALSGWALLRRLAAGFSRFTGVFIASSISFAVSLCLVFPSRFGRWFWCGVFVAASAADQGQVDFAGVQIGARYYWTLTLSPMLKRDAALRSPSIAMISGRKLEIVEAAHENGLLLRLCEKSRNWLKHHRN